MANLKVMMLTKEFPNNIYGGAGVHVDYLSQNLAEIMDVEVRAFAGEEDLVQDQREATAYQAWPEVSKNTDQRFIKAVNALSVDLAMAKDKSDADIVHCHTWYTFMGGFWVKKLYDIPLVTTIHSMEPLRPWKEEQLGNAYHLSSWMERTAVEDADKIIAVSKEMKKDILEHYNVQEEEIEVIYNGIDLNQYQYTASTTYREEYGIDPNKPYILFVGRITRQKGIIHLVNAIKDINEEAQVVLCAGAPDTEEIEEEMNQKVTAIQQERDGVIWINEMVSKEAVIEFYSNATVFCCPSVYEPFGIINLEAMACKTPVVASAVGGIKEVVVDGETGFLVDFEQVEGPTGEPKDPAVFSQALADKINQVLADEELQQKFGQNGRQRVEEIFSWEAIAKQTKELYQQLVK
ncbi:glycogen synthase [Natroniella acetigena]|uniref:glycogen synthase n=1 Tax=Natroniella acetigena TaxID=52004 RepID=UPI00200B8A6A|nr:glycogen synthase [Natroniella acetigena]MCK8828246.1 glycogen synthase [Natroniella acetigena]